MGVVVSPSHVVSAAPSSSGEDSSHSSPAPVWGPSHKRQSFTNISNVGPSHGLQFLEELLQHGPFPWATVLQEQTSVGPLQGYRFC